MKLLHIDASILGAHSASRQLTAAAVEQLRRQNPGLAVTYRDLAAEPLPHLSGDQLPPGASAVLSEFLAADIVVIGAPMYNFTLPSQLKAWIDRVVVSGQTFRYGAGGVEGLAGGKRVILVVSRGGFYGAGAPAAALEHLESYLSGVFGFIGIAPEIIVAEGLQVSPEQRQKAMEAALAAAGALQAA